MWFVYISAIVGCIVAIVVGAITPMPEIQRYTVVFWPAYGLWFTLYAWFWNWRANKR